MIYVVISSQNKWRGIIYEGFFNIKAVKKLEVLQNVCSLQILT